MAPSRLIGTASLFSLQKYNLYFTLQRFARNIFKKIFQPAVLSLHEEFLSDIWLTAITPERRLRRETPLFFFSIVLRQVL